MSDWKERFISGLRRIASVDDPSKAERATLAHLRRGLPQHASVTLSRVGHVFAMVPEEDTTRAVLVAGLFATHPAEGGRSMGAALHRLRGGNEESTTRIFTRLVDSHRDELPDRLRHVVKLLKAKNIALDYFMLLNDLKYWNHPERSVQWRWSRQYWQAMTNDTESETLEGAPQ